MQKYSEIKEYKNIMGANQAFLDEREEKSPLVTDWTRLLIGCRREQYCASMLARAVEDCNAHILNLNVTTPGAITGDAAIDDKAIPDFPVQVELQVSIRNSESITRSLERYGFTVLDCVSSDNDFNDKSIENYRNLMRYLEI